jgi:F-type H+-transporting ATPase subunit delta
MIAGSVARRYARALFELALEEGNSEKVGEDVAEFTAALAESAEVWRTLTNPGLTRPERRDLLDQLLTRAGLQVSTNNFMRLLIDNGRLDHVPAIAREYRDLNDAHLGRIRATVRSAVELDSAEIDRLRGLLQDVSGKTVMLEHRVEPDLIGGMVTEVGGLMFDGSLRTQLRRIRERLVLRGA